MPNNETDQTVEAIVAAGPGVSVTVRLGAMREVRKKGEDAATKLDIAMLRAWDRSTLALREAESNQGQLRELIKAVTAPPWFPAAFLRAVNTDQGQRAVVGYGGHERWVTLGPGLAMDQFQVGDEVFLTHELNAILGKSPEPRPRHGETAVFDRMDGDQLVLRHRDDQILAWPAQYMTAADLKTGDRVLWDRNTFLVYDVIAKADPYALNELPDVRPEAVGGQDQILSRLLSVLTAVLVDPAKAALYGLAGKQSILMYGPPGCGKTLMARVAAARVGQLSGRKVRFFRVKPCEWESPWVGMTETHIRELFASLREAAHDGLAVLFLDEVESMGRQRGGSHSRHDDDALAALLAELDGFEARGNVAVIAATNRKDLIDSALLERLSDVEVHVPRPDMRGARSIFSIHLPDSLPYSPNGELANTTRKEIIETAVARLYSPNSDAARLCTLRFKDGSVRNIAARELASGRLIEQMCRAARHAACLRDVNGGPPGVAVRDIEEAVESAVERLATTLTVRNVHSYLSDVPTDMDVVAVEPVSRKLKSPRRFMHSPRSQEVHHG